VHEALKIQLTETDSGSNSGSSVIMALPQGGAYSIHDSPTRRLIRRTGKSFLRRDAEICTSREAWP